MHIAISKLQPLPDYLLVDGLSLSHPPIPSQKIIGGDRLAYCIAAASILAKTYRDQQMRNLHLLYPNYDWFNNKGYNSKKHMNGLNKFGVSPMHRMSFDPMKSMIIK